MIFKYLKFSILFNSFFLITSCNNKIDNSHKKEVISSHNTFRVEKLISQLEKLIKLKSTRIHVKDFNFYSLNNNDIIKIYNALYAKKDAHPLYAKLSFEVKDAIIRRAYISSRDKKNDTFRTLNEVDFINKIDFSKQNFYELFCDDCRSDDFLDKSIIKVSKKPLINNSIINIVHISFEAPNARVGGIGEYLSGILNAELISLKNTSFATKIKGNLVTPFYDFLKHKYLEKVSFVGIVNNYIDGKIYKSSIYKLIEKDIIQFFIQPDPNYIDNELKKTPKQGWEIFDVEKQTHIYEIVENNAGWLYYSTAAASFISLFHGENFDNIFDIVHINGKYISFVNIIQKKLNEKRSNKSLPKVGILSTIHDNYPGNFIDTSSFERLGLQKPTSDKINLITLMNTNSHTVNYVSKSSEKEVLMPCFLPEDPTIAEYLNILYNQGRFVGINNGIFFKDFDITDNKVLGSLKVSSDYSNYETKKQEAKKLLYKHGTIGSETKTLFLFVGRFAPQKGIDVLADFAKEMILNKNGQVVIMGALSGYFPIELFELRSMENDPNYKGLLKLYTNYEKDQLTELDNTGATKGKIIRFASDFTLVPSVLEAAGLVPVEGLSMGSATISSYKEGLRDQCTNPYGSDNNIHNFTCIPFRREKDDTYNSIQNLIRSLQTPLKEWQNLSQKEKTAVQLRLINNAKTFDWNTPKGSLDQYIDLYKKTIDFANKY